MTWQKRVRGADLTHAEFRVLMILFSYSSENGRNIRPGKERIVRDARASEPTVRKALRELQRKGWIVLTEEGGNQHGKGKANVYALSTPRQRSERGDADDPNERHELEGVKGVNSFPEGGQSFSGRVQMVYPPSDHSSDHSSDHGSSRRGSMTIGAGSNSAWKPKPDVVERYNASPNVDDFSEAEQQEILDYFETELDCLDSWEQSTAEGMLASGQRTYSIVNMIRKQRSPGNSPMSHPGLRRSRHPPVPSHL